MTDVDTIGPVQGGGARRAPGWRRRLPVAALLACGLFGLVALAGFASFVRSVPTVERTDVGRADAIVALTGGAGRLADALGLLESGHARRLLITGVNPVTTGEELVRELPRFERFADCCVDLDRRAANTLGNALETRRWVRDRGFRSIIVVTSGYHMPRALLELGRELPDVALIPYPVVTPRLKDGWWRDPTAAKVMVSEYLKYVAAAAKVRLAPAVEHLSPTAAAAIRL